MNIIKGCVNGIGYFLGGIICLFGRMTECCRKGELKAKAKNAIINFDSIETKVLNNVEDGFASIKQRHIGVPVALVPEILNESSDEKIVSYTLSEFLSDEVQKSLKSKKGLISIDAILDEERNTILEKEQRSYVRGNVKKLTEYIRDPENLSICNRIRVIDLPMKYMYLGSRYTFCGTLLKSAVIKAGLKIEYAAFESFQKFQAKKCEELSNNTWGNPLIRVDCLQGAWQHYEALFLDEEFLVGKQIRI